MTCTHTISAQHQASYSIGGIKKKIDKTHPFSMNEWEQKKEKYEERY